MNQTQLSIMPVGVCNFDCPNCVQKPWRKDFADYHMLPDEVRHICRRVKELGLHFSWAHITGGEPSLWKFLYEGCQIMRESGAFDHIEVWSNCRAIKPLKRVLDDGLIDQVITQSGNTYTKGAEVLKAQYGGKMNIITSQGHQVCPTTPMDNVLPAACGCDRVEVFNGRVYPCANVYSNMKRMGLDVERSGLWADLDDDWRTAMDSIDRYNMQACRVCLANGNISRQMPVVKAR